MGTLFVSQYKGDEVYAFEYDAKWLEKTKMLRFMLDPNLEFYRGRQYSSDENLFGVFLDSCPDRWGQVLMKRKEALIAEKENRKPKKLFQSDYLLGVYDETRMGALQFKLSKEGPFIADDENGSVPPWATLRDLEEAARGFEMSTDEETEKWLRQLLKPGSSLGGARPKANVQDPDGNIWIAKFPSNHDETDIGAWEKITNDLAKMCGLNVPETSLCKFSSKGSTFLTKRFDREGKKRIHFASAMTLLGKRDGSSFQDGSSYLDLVDFIRAFGANPEKDIKELWKRIIFNMAVSNIDDHLRNHGFLLTERGWILSPLYDVNPVPYGEDLSLNVTYDNNHICMNTLLEFADIVDLDREQAVKDIRDILQIVCDNWELVAKKFKLTRELINSMRPAFEFSNQIKSKPA